MATRGSSDIREGMEVFDVDRDKIGSVEEVAGGGAGYMKVKTGLLGLGGSWYIPFDAVREVRSDRIYLSAGKDDADRLGWNAPPTAARQTGRVDTTRETTRAAESREGVQVREEELRPRKETVEAGEVGIRKEVVTEQRSMDAQVTREEQVRVEKEPVVTEEVSVGKQSVRESERVSGTVRREEARVEREGDVDVRGDEQRRRKE